MKKLEKVLAGILRINEKEVDENLSINNTDTWDSLKHMELIVTIEETYAVKLTTEEIINMVNIRKIKHILKQKGIKF